MSQMEKNKGVQNDSSIGIDFDKLFAKNPLPMVISELPSGKIIETNAAFLNKLQHKKSNVIGKTIIELFNIEDLTKLEKIKEAIKKEQHIDNLDIKIRMTTGEMLYGFISGEIFESQGKNFFCLIIIDVTLYRETERDIRKKLIQQEMLAEASTRLNQYKNFKRTINELLKKIAIHTKADRAYIYENNFHKKTANNIFEWCTDKVKPRIKQQQDIPFESIPFFKKVKKERLFASNDISTLPQKISNGLKQQDIKSLLVLQLTVKKKFFGFIGFEQIAQKKEWSSSEIVMLEKIAASISSVYEKRQNIKEVKLKTEYISQEKNKIETIIKSIGDGVFVIDVNLRIVLINPVAIQLCGYSEEEALNKKYSKIFRFVLETDLKKQKNDFILQAMENGEVQLMPRHILLISRGGKKIPVADSVAPLKVRGKIIGCVVVFRDATREREIDRMKSEFVSLASHQLKTPITGIKWMSELMLKEELSYKQKDYMLDIHESTNKLVKLIENLLDLSHMETGRKFDIVKKKTSLNKILKEVIENNKGFAQSKGIDIKYKNNVNNLTLNIDGVKVKYALNNIVNNAIKYSSISEGKVVLDEQKKSNSVVIRIKDNGIGIPRFQQEKVFDKFFRADNVQSDNVGTGLGLSIAKSIIEAHDGHIWFDSQKGNGTTFYLELPLK